MSQAPETSTDAPWPGSRQMPRWNLADLIDAPRWEWSKCWMLLGPALLMGGSAIGGGEWLTGPAVTARYGGALMWLATFSILGQVVYNVEISRYTLYCGEPIFTGKFRTLPGPLFWVWVYLIADFGAVFPYLAANAATPAATIFLGHVPNPEIPFEKSLLKGLGMAVFLLAFVPLVFGGKIYNALKAIMTFKIVVVLGFLLALGLFFTSSRTWSEVFAGFLKLGNVPIQRAEDANGNGVLDPGEDWDGDTRLDKVEPGINNAKPESFDFDGDGQPDKSVNVNAGVAGEPAEFWPDIDGDGNPDSRLKVDTDGNKSADTWVDLKPNDKGRPTLKFLDYDADGIRDGDNVDNVFSAMLAGRSIHIELSMIAYLAAFAAIAGSGGLSNTPTSNYTRDQGWGMGHHVGAIPSIVGGHNITLSHEGTVFQVTPEALPRWRRWYRHVLRDQLIIWMPACFLGIALPSMLSVEFLPRGTPASDWTSAAMTAGGVEHRVAEDTASVLGTENGKAFGRACWYMTLFCGFLVLAPSMATSIDGFVRRWVDVFWTASGTLRALPPDRIKYVYFGVLCAYLVFGLTILQVFEKPGQLVKISTNIMNFALGFSCWHVVVINCTLLPRELRPNWLIRIALFITGLFFLTLAAISFAKAVGWV